MILLAVLAYLFVGFCIFLACHGPGVFPRPRLIVTWLPALVSSLVNNRPPEDWLV